MGVVGHIAKAWPVDRIRWALGGLRRQGTAQVVGSDAASIDTGPLQPSSPKPRQARRLDLVLLARDTIAPGDGRKLVKADTGGTNIAGGIMVAIGVVVIGTMAVEAIALGPTVIGPGLTKDRCPTVQAQPLTEVGLIINGGKVDRRGGRRSHLAFLIQPLDKVGVEARFQGVVVGDLSFRLRREVAGPLNRTGGIGQLHPVADGLSLAPGTLDPSHLFTKTKDLGAVLTEARQ